MNDGARWLPWLKVNPEAADDRTFDRVWVPAVDVLAILDDRGADVLRAALGAVLEDVAPLDDRGGGQADDPGRR